VQRQVERKRDRKKLELLTALGHELSARTCSAPT
jgi:hypothetical protein